MSKTILKFAVVQDGQCVFGTGSTPLAAYRDACKWLEPKRVPSESSSFDDEIRYTPAMVEAECDEFQFSGDLRLISSDDDEFDSYLRNQGGFVQSSRGNWRNA
jgi:hypothetical protein